MVAAVESPKKSIADVENTSLTIESQVLVVVDNVPCAGVVVGIVGGVASVRVYREQGLGVVFVDVSSLSVR